MTKRFTIISGRFAFYIFALVLLSNCSKVDVNTRSSTKSYSFDTKFATLQAGVVDNNGEYLYITLLNIFTNETELFKFDLNTLEKVKSYSVELPNTITFGHNLLYATDNHLYGLQQSYLAGTGNYEVTTKFTPDLQIVGTDTVFRLDSVPPFIPSLNLRSRLCQPAAGQFARATTILDYNLKYGIRYELMDGEFNRVKTVVDTSSYPGIGFRLGVNQMLPTSDGGYIVNGVSATPTTGIDFFIEKRDADFNQLWTTTYSTPAVENIAGTIESNGYFYSYVKELNPETQIYNLFMLQHDDQGNLVKRLDLKSSGKETTLRETFEQTADGGFLCPGMTSVNATQSSSKAILYKVSPDLEIESYEVFGESVISGNIYKISDNKFVYVYGEMGFGPEEGDLRTVLTYVDQNGKVIK